MLAESESWLQHSQDGGLGEWEPCLGQESNWDLYGGIGIVLELAVSTESFFCLSPCLFSLCVCMHSMCVCVCVRGVVACVCVYACVRECVCMGLCLTLQNRLELHTHCNISTHFWEDDMFWKCTRANPPARSDPLPCTNDPGGKSSQASSESSKNSIHPSPC